MHSSNFSLLSCSGKSLKYPGKLKENSGSLVSQKCGHPEENILTVHTSQTARERIQKEVKRVMGRKLS